MVARAGFDAVLLTAQAGDDVAFSQLYRDLNPGVLRYLTARAPGAGQDLAAETWMAVAGQIAAFRGDESAFRAWLFTIARRRLIQHWRDQRRRPSEPTDPDHLQDLPDGPDGIDPAEVAVDRLSAREAVAVISAALTPDQADVVLLRLVAGLDVDQVAAVLEKRPGTVRVLQHKAVRRLAGQMSREALTL